MIIDENVVKVNTLLSDSTYNSLLTALVESSDDAIISKTPDGIITTWNVAAERMFGYSAKEILGKPISILVPKDSQEEFSLILEKIKKDQRIEHFETKRLNKDGKILNVSVTLSPIKNKEGKIIGISKIVRNITERKQSEQERIKLASIVESSEDAILGMNLDGIIDSWNSGAVKMFGYKENEIIGKSVQLIYPSERTEELPGIIQKLRAGARIEHFETERKRKDESIIDVSLSISPIKNEKGIIVGIAKIIRDISGQKRTSAYARSLIEASLDPLVTISLEGKITDVNDATVKVTGVTREWLIGTDFSNYFTEQRRARDGYRLTFKEGSVKDYPLTIRHSSGKTTDVLYNASVYKDDKGNARGVFAAARDVTETKKVSQYARSLIEASLDPLVTISAEGKITDVNDATVKVTGVTRDKLIGTDFSNYFTKPDDARKGYERVFNKGFVTDYPLSIRHASGQITDVLYNASVYKDDKGNVLGVFAAARDATQVKQKDEFSAMVGHELKTPLVPILGYSELLLSGDMGKLTETQNNSVKTIFDNATRLLRLIQDILDVRKTELGKLNLDIRDVNAKEIIAQCLTAFKTTSQSKEITLVDNSQDIPLQCDFERIIQVINNLLSNAFKFTPQKYGKIEVGAKIDNDSVIFSVKDNGIGIPKDKQVNLFKKFYQVDTSIKRSALGSGLGLAICRGIIESHKGKIWLESEAEKGTIVYFSILRKMT